MNKNSNKYRVSIYLGKKTYEEVEPMATFLGLSVSQFCKVLLDTGLMLSSTLETVGKETLKNGKSKK